MWRECILDRYIYCNNDDMGMVLLTAPLSQLPPACAITLRCPSVPEGMTCPELRGDYVATSHFIWGRSIYKHVDTDTSSS